VNRLGISHCLESGDPVISYLVLLPQSTVSLGVDYLLFAAEAICNSYPGYGCRHILRRKGVRHKNTVWLHGWAYSRSRLCSFYRPASGHRVRGVSETNQGPHQIEN